MDAIIFDFDGVVVDSEPVHLACFQQVLRGIDIDLASEDYYTRYLGFDDRDCFAAVLADHDRPVRPQHIAEMTAEKTLAVQKTFAESIQALPGAVALIRAADAAGVPLAVCSGALREEIRLAARTVGVLPHFRAIVSAEDVRRGKPDPEGYRLALRHLCDLTGRTLAPQRSIVIEDAPAGIKAGKAAGMHVLAVATSYPADELASADCVVDSLTAVDPVLLESLL